MMTSWRKSVKYILTLLVMAWAALASASPCPSARSKDADALTEVEQAWAQALEKRDVQTVGCILADEFQDFDPYGQVHDRTEALARLPHRRPGANQLSELAPHLHGDFGYVRGLNTIVVDGKTVAKVRFTDIFVYRDGRWQAVAGQEAVVTEPPSQP